MNDQKLVQLHPEKIEKIEIFGFHKTQEGRTILRELFEPFLNRVKFREGKIASLIADRTGSLDAQTAEIDRTKNALKRWHKEGQAELWLKDYRKNIRYFSRLEAEMMSIDDFAEILSDQAASIFKVQSGSAFGRFYYGFDSILLPKDTEYMQSQLEGLYEIYETREENHHPDPQKHISVDGEYYRQVEPGEERKEPPWQYYEESGKSYVMVDQFSWDAPSGEYGQHNGDYIYVKRVKGQSYMLVHSFYVIQGSLVNRGKIRLGNLRSGYGFVLDDGTFHVLLSAHGPLSPRSYDIYVPTEKSYRGISWTRKNQDILRVWSHTARPFYPRFGSYPSKVPTGARTLPFDGPTMWAKPMYVEENPLKEYIDNILWNVLV